MGSSHCHATDSVRENVPEHFKAPQYTESDDKDGWETLPTKRKRDVYKGSKLVQHSADEGMCASLYMILETIIKYCIIMWKLNNIYSKVVDIYPFCDYPNSNYIGIHVQCCIYKCSLLSMNIHVSKIMIACP